jgi:hypothetical protein
MSMKRHKNGWTESWASSRSSNILTLYLLFVKLLLLESFRSEYKTSEDLMGDVRKEKHAIGTRKELPSLR